MCPQHSSAATTCLVTALLVSAVVHLGSCAILPYRIAEELPIGTLVGNVATDAGLHSKYPSRADFRRLRFSFLTQPDLVKKHFTIEERTGILKTTARIDRDVICAQKKSCTVKIDLAVSPIEFFQIIKVGIEILDVNDNRPQFAEDHMVQQVLESAVEGTSFAIQPAFDKDSGSNRVQLYRLVSKSRKFELKSKRNADGTDDVRLVLKETLDRETQDFYQIKVVAIDGGRPPKTGSVTIDIRVQDTNDNDPKFENSTYDVAVYENIPIHTTIVRVKAGDPDDGPNGAVEYSFTKHTANSYGHLFGIDSVTGAVFVKGILDYEEGFIYLLSLTARDKGPDSLPAHTTVEVRVKDLNDNAPEITLNTLAGNEVAEISELHAKPGTFVAQVLVTDKDSGMNGKVACSLNSANFHLQDVDVMQYIIITATKFDREVQDHFTLTLECRDKGFQPKLSRRTLKVKIMDENDHTPVFSQKMYSVNLMENNNIGAFIVQVNATDKDTGPNALIRYHMHRNSGNVFTIDHRTGIIKANIRFDYEKIKQLQCQVIAADHGNPRKSATATINLSIIDKNDEKPIFSEVEYAFGVFENEKFNTEIGQVTATDSDAEPFNKFTYHFAPHLHGDGYFAINHSTGQITTRTELDREYRSAYYLVVVAADPDYPSMQSSASVSIYVADKNDNDPIFDYPVPSNNTVKISNKVPPGHVFAKVRAHDDDAGGNARLAFHIHKGNEDELFGIDPETGILSIKNRIYSSDYRQYRLLLLATDHGSPERSAETVLNIIIDKSVAFPEPQKSALVGNSLIIVISLSAFAGILVIVIISAIIAIIRRHRHAHKNSTKAKTRKDKNKAGLDPTGPPEPTTHTSLLSGIERGDGAEATTPTGKLGDAGNLDNAINQSLQSIRSSNGSNARAENPQGSDVPAQGVVSETIPQCQPPPPDVTEHTSCHQALPPQPAASQSQACNSLPRHRLVYCPKPSNPGVANRQWPGGDPEAHAGEEAWEQDSDTGSNSTDGSNTDSGHGPSEDGETVPHANRTSGAYHGGDGRQCQGGRSDMGKPPKDGPHLPVSHPQVRNLRGGVPHLSSFQGGSRPHHPRGSLPNSDNHLQVPRQNHRGVGGGQQPNNPNRGTKPKPPTRYAQLQAVINQPKSLEDQQRQLLANGVRSVNPQQHILNPPGNYRTYRIVPGSQANENETGALAGQSESSKAGTSTDDSKEKNKDEYARQGYTDVSNV